MNDNTISSLNKIFDLGDIVNGETGEVEPEPVAVVTTVASKAPVAPPETGLAVITGELIATEDATVATTESSDESYEDRHRKMAEEDFEFSRSAIKAVAVDTQHILHRAFEVAEQTDSARSFEVAGELVKAVLETHAALRETHKAAAANQYFAPTKEKNDGQVNIQNGIVFNGTPEELLRIIKPERQ